MRIAYIVLLPAALLCGCRTSRWVSIQTRCPSDTPNVLARNCHSPYAREDEYIRSRRRTARVEQPLDREHPPIGLAFSGGGIRSATFHLGVLQELQRRRQLKEADYLSCVSGGAYIGAWLAGHALPAGEPDQYGPEGFLAASADVGRLLQTSREGGGTPPAQAGGGTPGPVDHLRGSSHFLVSPEFGYPGLVGSWLMLFPFNLVDVALHFKPLRGKFNWPHPFYQYRERINETYLAAPRLGAPDRYPSDVRGDRQERKDIARENGRCRADTLLCQINPSGSSVPYLIVSGALRLPCYWFASSTAHFEFTRDYCGSHETGYVETPGFDLAVLDVEREECGVPVRVRVADCPYPLLKAPTTKPFRLASAVTASGAALDEGALPGIKWSAVRFVFRLLNLTTRYQTRNFAQSLERPLAWPLDRLRELTLDRFYPTERSNTLNISDGGHYDNLGLTALVRRRLPVIYCFDASADSEYRYTSLRATMARLRSESCGNAGCRGLRLCFEDEAFQAFLVRDRGKGEPGPPVQADIVRRAGLQCDCSAPAYGGTVYYCKNSFSGCYTGMPDLVRCYAGQSRVFPHRTTAKQVYDLAEFEAYRHIGQFVVSQLLDEVPSLPDGELKGGRQ